MTTRYSPIVTLANGQPAHTRRVERLRQPPVPSVRFIGDPVEAHVWTGHYRWALGVAVMLLAGAWVVGLVL